MSLKVPSGCKVNLVLNILGKRPDGFHELETVMLPVPIFDYLEIETVGAGITLTCSESSLSVGEDNLVVRAAKAFFEKSRISGGTKIHLTKNLPIVGGIGAGSANAAVTLMTLNDLYGKPLTFPILNEVGAALGSDVPFFLQPDAALGTGRGEQVQPIDETKGLHGSTLLLVHPGFGVPTVWAYKELKQYPECIAGKPGRAVSMAQALKVKGLKEVCDLLFNSMEKPVLAKHPILGLYQNFFKSNGAAGALMSGSGSTTFAFFSKKEEAEAALEKHRQHFGENGWTAKCQL